jgi:Fungal specific transcription factor domain
MLGTPALHQEPTRPRYLPPSAEMVSPPTVYLDDEDDDEMDDYYDVESDEEEDMAEVTQAEGFNQLSLIVASASRDEQQRSFTTFLDEPNIDEPNILATYRPSMGSSPLNNPKTARIWVHFIHATGPSLSIWERHPTNTSALFGDPVPVAQQGLWTYTMPLKALEFPALLQAILAISSLHIAKLQQATLTISSKHYHYALRRLRKALSLPFRRKQPATLAATLVLAFFEVMAAEHSKWDTHVAGAAQLIKEIDFAGLTRDLRAHRRRRMRLQCDPYASVDPWLRFGPLFRGLSEDDPFAGKEAGVNEDLVGMLMGRAVNYDEFGQVEDEGQRPRAKKSFSRKDIENFRIQTDLYWWYCKQDLFQSMISGNRL